MFSGWRRAVGGLKSFEHGFSHGWTGGEKTAQGSGEKHVLKEIAPARVHRPKPQLRSIDPKYCQVFWIIP
jgi:hypothetical protein